MSRSEENKYWTKWSDYVDAQMKGTDIPREDREDMRQDIMLDMFLQHQSDNNVMTVEQGMAFVERQTNHDGDDEENLRP